MTTSAFSMAVTRALTSSSSYSYGALMKPDIRAVPSEETRGFMPPPLAQWVLQGDQFDTTLLDQYRKIKIGETKLLVAATGVGKTTILPLRLVSMSGKAGLVLLPNNLLVSTIVKYVSGTVLSSGSYNVHVDALRSKYIKTPVRGPAVYYSSAEDFLPRFHADKSLVKRLNLDFIYLDEAHENTPAYYVMRMFVGLGFFSDTRVFYGTATSAGTSLLLTGTQNQAKPQPRPPSEFPLLNPEGTPSTSPMYHRNITCRVAIFLPSDHHVNLWEKYYDDYDIGVLTYRTYDGSRKISSIEASLSAKLPMVLLTVSRLQTGFTFSVDAVVCTGYTQDLEVDYSVPCAELVIRPVTQVERTQRMGRAGRHLAGYAYYNDVKLTPPLPELNNTTALYVWMWARLFRIQIKNPEVAQFSQFMGEFSDEFVSLMLCSRLHPVLVMPYLTTEGEIFDGWHVMKHVFHTDKSIQLSDFSNEESVQVWPERNTGPQDWLDEPIVYRSRSGFPDEWQALPVAAWRAYSTGETSFGLSLDNASVVSALVPDPPKSVSKPRKTVSIASIPETVASRPLSVMTTGKSNSPVGEKFEGAISNKSVLGKIDEISSFNNLAISRPSHARKPSTAATEEIVRDPVKDWVETVDSRATKRRSSRKSSSSNSSHDRFLVELKKVNPNDYKYYKLYPLDSLWLSQYLSAEAAHEDDFYRFSRLIRVRQNFSNLSSDPQKRVEMQGEYFLSVIRVHNHQVMEKLQIRASGASRPGFVDRFLGRDYTTVDANIEQSSKLLASLQFEGFFVGVDKRTLHTASGDFSPVLEDKIERSRATAQYLLHTAELQLSTTINDLSLSCFAIKKDSIVIGTAWKFGHVVVMSHHVYIRDEFLTQHQLLCADELRDFAVCRTDLQLSDHPKLRGPVDGETVLAVGVDPYHDQYCPLGPMELFRVGSVWCINKSLREGFSGFALVSVEDYAIVGLYSGHYMTTDESSEYGHFVPSTDFLSEVARAY